jgi:hypothetical protein
MRAAFGIVGLLVVLAIGYAIYSSQIRHVTGGKPGIQQVHDVAVKSDLLALAQSERLYLAANGSYATLEELRGSGVSNFFPADRAGYEYIAEVDGAAHFRITASPKDSSQPDFPILSIDETMQIARVR